MKAEDAGAPSMYAVPWAASDRRAVVMRGVIPPKQPQDVYAANAP
jgi:hypothetical protein